MEPVEQDWRQYYDACYDRPGGPPAGDVAPDGSKISVPLPLNPDGMLAKNPPAQPVGSVPRISADSSSKMVSGKRVDTVGVLGSSAGRMLIRSLIAMFIACLCVLFLALIVSGSTSSSFSGGTSVEVSKAEELSLRVDAPIQPAPPSGKHRPDAAVVRAKMLPTGQQAAHKKKAKPRKTTEANLWDADNDDSENEELKEKNSPCGEPRQTYCAKSVLSFFYRSEHDICDSSFHEQVFVCNHSPNRFSSLKGCTNACIKNSKPFTRCLQEPIFTKCNRNDLKSSYWYREGRACVEWKYPNGHCATKHRGVARSLRECRDICMGPGTHEGSCTLPAEYTCPTEELKFPYFAHTFPNGTVVCLEADAEVLRPHKCMTGKNKYPTRHACRQACTRKLGPALSNGTFLSEL